jgi:diaminopimelate epimerase
MIDNRDHIIDNTNLDIVRKLCDRKFGIGSDGLILIENHDTYDFEMIFYNPDGSQSLCGNGSRCAVKFAHSLSIIHDEAHFFTIEGPLFAFLRKDLVHLKMPDVNEVTCIDNDWFINTGSPHYVRLVTDVESVDVFSEGRDIRYHSDFSPGGTNVNFMQLLDPQHLYVRTYERGVENETLSCGTGITAAALAIGFRSGQSPVKISTKGGQLSVDFKKQEQKGFTEIYLIGPAEKVYDGSIYV